MNYIFVLYINSSEKDEVINNLKFTQIPQIQIEIQGNIVEIKNITDKNINKVYEVIENENFFKYIYGKKIKKKGIDDIGMYQEKSDSLLYDYLKITPKNYFWVNKNKKEKEIQEILQHSLHIYWDIGKKKFVHTEQKSDFVGPNGVFFPSHTYSDIEENIKKEVNDKLNTYSSTNKNISSFLEEKIKNTYCFAEKNNTQRLEKETPQEYYKRITNNNQNKIKEIKLGEKHYYYPLFLFSFTENYDKDQLIKDKKDFNVKTVLEYYPEGTEWTWEINMDVLYYLMSEENIENSKNMPLSIIKLYGEEKKNNNTEIEFQMDNYEVDLIRLIEKKTIELKYLGIFMLEYSGIKDNDTFPYCYIIFIFYDDIHKEIQFYNRRGYRIHDNYLLERCKVYYSEINFIEYLYKSFPDWFDLYLYENEKGNKFLYLFYNNKDYTETAEKRGMTKISSFEKVKKKIYGNMEITFEINTQSGGNLMMDKDVYHLDFDVNMKNLKELDSAEKRILLKIRGLTMLKRLNRETRRDIFIKHHSYLLDLDYKHNLKELNKDIYLKSYIMSISKFGITIDNVVFIKMFLKLNLVSSEEKEKKNVLIQCFNSILTVSLFHYLLLIERFDITKNIYVKNMLKSNLEELKRFNIHKNFDSRVKYDIIVYDLITPSGDIYLLNPSDIEIRHIDFLFESTRTISKFLNINGTILIHFYFFGLRQTIDYIRLISYYFDNTKIYDFSISGRLGNYFVCFEKYNGRKINLKTKYFKFSDNIKDEELKKLYMINQNRHNLQKSILKFHFTKYLNFTDKEKTDYIRLKNENGINLLKSLGYTDTDIRVITPKKYLHFIHFFNQEHMLKVFNFNFKNVNDDNILNKKKIINMIETSFWKIIIPLDVLDAKLYYLSKKKTRLFKNSLKRMVNERLNVRYISQAWCKALEMYHFIFVENNKVNVKKIRSFHLAEYPGNFIRSLSYFCKSKNISLDWKAQSLVESNNNIKHIDDTYQFAEKTREHWDYGKDKTGNLLNPENQAYYINVLKKYKPNFITADGGLPKEKNNDSSIFIKLLKSEINIIINSLELNGSCIIKVYLPSLDIKDDIEKLYKSFESIYFLKSPINRYSPEYYIYCKGFSKNRMTPEKTSNGSFDNLFFSNVIELMNNFQNQINLQIFIYDSFFSLAKKYVENIQNIIVKKNIEWIDNFL